MASISDDDKDAAKTWWRRKGLYTFLAGVSILLVTAFSQTGVSEALRISGVNLTCFGCVAVGYIYSGSKYTRVLRCAPLVFLGLISYCMYLSHIYVMRVFDSVFPYARSSSLSMYFGRLLTILAVTLLVCFLSRRYFEQPILRLRRYVLRGPGWQLDISPAVWSSRNAMAADMYGDWSPVFGGRHFVDLAILSPRSLSRGVRKVKTTSRWPSHTGYRDD